VNIVQKSKKFRLSKKLFLKMHENLFSANFSGKKLAKTLKKMQMCLCDPHFWTHFVHPEKISQGKKRKSALFVPCDPALNRKLFDSLTNTLDSIYPASLLLTGEAGCVVCSNPSHPRNHTPFHHAFVVSPHTEVKSAAGSRALDACPSR
jgi:hypothetical protein